MISVIKTKAISIAESLHLRIFGHPMSEEMRKFLGYLSWSFFGGIFAAGIMFGVNIFAGRILGPEGYGKYNYLLSLATASMFVFLLGNNSSGVRYISDKRHARERESILTAAFAMSLVQASLFLVAILFLRGLISQRFGIDEKTVYLIFTLGFVLSFKDLLDSFLRALGLIKKQSFFKIADAVTVAVVFLSVLYFLRSGFSHLDYIYAFMIGGVLFMLCALYAIRGNFARFGWEHVSLLFNYNKFLILASIGGFIIGLDKVFIGKYIGTEELGVYSAYYASSQLIISNLLIIFMNIFWPTAIKNKESLSVIMTKVNTLFFKFFPIAIFLNFFSILFFVYLFGSKYPFNLSLAVLFSVASILNVSFFLVLSLLNIEKINNSVVLTFVCYSLMVLSVVIFKNINIYLLVQILVYSCGILFVRHKLKQKAV